VRLDKWLWAARFFKTRALAVEAIGKNRVEVNAQPAKPGREVRLGDTLLLREPGMPPRELRVLGLSQVRGPAPVAQQLYEETASSLSAREAAREAAARAWSPPRPSPRAGRPSATGASSATGTAGAPAWTTNPPENISGSRVLKRPAPPSRGQS
jgi:ribosome-associated heat shock protein Hsp15